MRAENLMQAQISIVWDYINKLQEKEVVISRSTVEDLVIMNTMDDNLRARHIFFAF